MSDPVDEQSVPDQLPDSLVKELDTLGSAELRVVHEYVEQRLTESQQPIEEQILEDAEGEVLSIEDRGIYTLVRKRPPSQGDSERETRLVSLYQVTRERHPDGEETLHWSFLGDVHDTNSE
ncbi:hypothetical protein [Natrinema sp. 74]|uniref:hypothetical protein n=1 Tax=Natrinema sp. 74 TaxID=3384159 RepID=UPI0038D3C2A6